ncbi:MAG: hypothetical protein M1817_003152 [Caeruleum heppii]|nr:MAG: hypothetical protein M1817_003152 [Caeruleum heppii]
MDDRTLILGKLRHTFDQMRALPSPGFYGSVSGGKVPHALFWTADEKPKVNGPFQTGRDFILGLAEQSRDNWARNNRHSYRADFYEKHISRALDKYPAKFSHTDLLRQNVIVRDITAPDSSRKDYEVSVVDWEDAGWYPAYWEYAVAFGSFIWHEDDWPNVIESIISPWCAEAAMMKLIIEDLWM